MVFKPINTGKINIQKNPNEAKLDKVKLLLKEGKVQEALMLCNEICISEPTNELALAIAAQIIFQYQPPIEFEKFYTDVIRIQPKNKALRDIYSQHLLKTNRPELAEPILEEIFKERPRDIAVIKNLASLKAALGKVEESKKLINKALMIDPNSPEMLQIKGQILLGEKNYYEAITLYERALKQDPKNPQILNNLGNCYKDTGEIQKALDVYRQGIEIEPKNLVIWTNLLLAENYIKEDCSESHIKFRDTFRTNTLFPYFGNLRDPNKKLRVGFISFDFRKHSVGYFMKPIYENCDKDRYEVITYLDSEVNDSFTKEFIKNSYDFRFTARMPTEALAKLIRDDQLDVLFDLAGSTGYNRADLFKEKVAPVIFSYLGYCNTSAFHTIDYKILDPITAPKEIESQHEEKILRMSKTYCVYPKIEGLNPTTTPPSEKNGYITFLVTNYPAKFTEEIYKAWSEILKRVPNSKIFFKYSNFTDVKLQEKVRNKLVSLGVEPERILIKGYTETHMDEYNEGDICLDTFPYCGTTTTMDALTMNVPTLTIMGKAHHSRIGGLFNSLIGFYELVASDVDDYIEKAVKLANDKEFLKDFRLHCQERLDESALRDYKGFTDEFFDKIRWAWVKYCKDYEAN